MHQSMHGRVQGSLQIRTETHCGFMPPPPYQVTGRPPRVVVSLLFSFFPFCIPEHASESEQGLQKFLPLLLW